MGLAMSFRLVSSAFVGLSIAFKANIHYDFAVSNSKPVLGGRLAGVNARPDHQDVHDSPPGLQVDWS
jgi:hypothetical protein